MEGGPGRPPESQFNRVQSIDQFRDRAACKGVHPGVFYPGSAQYDERAAKKLCEGCEVIVECRQHANQAATREHHGIWAGEKVEERDKRRRKEARVRSARKGQLTLAQEAAQIALEPSRDQRTARQAFGGLM
jgi:WhiB family transcriptional regulator, redox-sensing transcriptional regulator